MTGADRSICDVAVGQLVSRQRAGEVRHGQVLLLSIRLSICLYLSHTHDIRYTILYDSILYYTVLCAYVYNNVYAVAVGRYFKELYDDIRLSVEDIALPEWRRSSYFYYIRQQKGSKCVI